MSEEAVRRAKEIAAKLSLGITSELGKRKSRWDTPQEESQWPQQSTLGPYGGMIGANKIQKKVFIPTQQYPDVNFMGLLIGPQGSNQKRMEEGSGARILIRGKGSSKMPTGDADENEDLHVLITADNDSQIAAAQKMIEEILFNPQEAMRLKQEQLRKVAELKGDSNGGGHYGPSGGFGSDGNSTQVPVSQNVVGYIIGKGGETIRELQMKSGAHIQVVRLPDGAPPTNERFVAISGSPDTVEIAKTLINEVITKYTGVDPSMISSSGGSTTITLVIPNEKVGLIIGRGGQTIKNIQSRSSSQVQIPPLPDNDNPANRSLTLCGSEEGLAIAKAEILALVQGQHTISAIGGSGADPGAESLYMQVPDHKVGIIIGKGGEVVKSLQLRHNLKVQIPQSADPGTNPPIRTICLNGSSKESVHAAKAEIDAIVSGQVMASAVAGGANSQYNSYGQQQAYASYYGAAATGYDQYGQYAQYDAAAYAQYYQQAAAATTAATSEGGATEGGTTTSTESTTDPNDPNSYWNGYYEYAAYYGVEAANAAWGVDTTATTESETATTEAEKKDEEKKN